MTGKESLPGGETMKGSVYERREGWIWRFFGRQSHVSLDNLGDSSFLRGGDGNITFVGGKDEKWGDPCLFI